MLKSLLKTSICKQVQSTVSISFLAFRKLEFYRSFSFVVRIRSNLTPISHQRQLRYLTKTMTNEIAAKKSKTEVVIGTHDGVFHCDEILACFMLQQLPEYENAKILRTRDLKKLEECDIVVDVGAVFDVRMVFRV